MDQRQQSAIFKQLAFGVGGIVLAKVAFAPFDRVKVQLQTQYELIKIGDLKKPYNGVWDALTRTVKYEGALALWRSLIPESVSAVTTLILKNVFNDSLRVFLPDDDSILVNFAKHALFSGFALVLAYPFSLASTRLSADIRSGTKENYEFTGTIDVFCKAWRANGFLGLYSGIPVAFSGILVYRGFYFGMVHVIHAALGESIDRQSEVGIHGLSAICSGLLSYSFDTVMRRMVVTADSHCRYNSSISCVSGILKNEGLGSLFKGFIVPLLRGILQSPMTILMQVQKTS